MKRKSQTYTQIRLTLLCALAVLITGCSNGASNSTTSASGPLKGNWKPRSPVR